VKILVLILVLTTALLAQCMPGTDLGDRPTDAPNIILIVMDTVRSDHLGCYGYERNTSPRIDAFANSATRYLNSIAAPHRVRADRGARGAPCAPLSIRSG